MKCIYCDSPVSDDANYCSECGKPVQQTSRSHDPRSIGRRRHPHGQARQFPRWLIALFGCAVTAFVILIMLGILAAIAIPNFLEAQDRAKISRAKSDMRTMATALEAYYVDNNSYPPWAEGLDSINPPHPSFRILKPSDKMHTLTTPIAYITRYIPDMFTNGLTYNYYCLEKGAGWILWSPGPDGDYDLTLERIRQNYIPAYTDENRTFHPTDASGLQHYSYNPTNGIRSSGDIYRIRQ